MQYQDLEQFAILFFAAHYIPIFIYNDNNFTPTFARTPIKDLTPSHFVLSNLKQKDNPGFFFTSETGFWGRVQVQNSKYSIIFGPVFSCEINNELAHAFMNHYGFIIDRDEEITLFLNNLPKYTQYRFLNMISFVNFSINNDAIDIIKHFDESVDEYFADVAKKHTESQIDMMENIRVHGTYMLEQQLIDFIRAGDLQNLKEFLGETIQTMDFVEGKLAENPLRQAKNIFIGAVTIFGKIGAIGGGLDIEETYNLIDTYIQECEHLSTIEEIISLQYTMLVDLTKRVHESKIPEGLSRDIYMCLQFISNHTNEPLGIDDVCNYIGRSRSYLTRKFKHETNKTIMQYIMDDKLTKSKGLLKFTDKSISEIAYFLSISSQAYYQTLFKKKFGETPNNYRKRFLNTRL